MYVLITGGAGYIGSHIALSLLQKNHHVIVLDNLCNSSPLALTRVEALSGKKITFHQGDIRRRADLNQVFNHQPIDCQKASPLCFKPGKITDKYEQLAMAKLIFSTSYLEYCSADNIYATDLITLQLRQNIQPFLQ